MLVLANIAGFIVAHWRYFVIGLAIIIVVIAAGITFKSCGSKPKFDEAAIKKAQDAIAKDDRKAMVEVLAESDVKEEAIDSNIKAIEQATENAKKNYNDLSNEELRKELEARK